jgi:dihydroceramidase
MVFLLGGKAQGWVVASLLVVTTTLYLRHDREKAAWGKTTAAHQGVGYWGGPTGDFDWCEPNYMYSEYVVEPWNAITSLAFLPGPASLLFGPGGMDLPAGIRMNCALVAAIGLGSVAFHATLRYEAQLLDELPMLCYIAHTVALLRQRTVPRWLVVGLATLSAVLFGTQRSHVLHQAGRLLLVFGFSGCFVWLAFSIAGICNRLDSIKQPSLSAAGTFSERYDAIALTVLTAIVSWVTDNLGCESLHALPFSMPYPQLHALVWHFGMARVCHFLCCVVIASGGSRHEKVK